jgi:hypothetical protein
MNLNPFELRNNDYYAKDLFEHGNYGSLRANKFGETYGSYEYLLKGIHIGVEWKIVCYAGSYQGELYCLGEHDNKFYYVNTGYGSCSGCDWYQANDGDIEGLQEIQDSLKRDIREFNNIAEFLSWFNDNNSGIWVNSEMKEFLAEVQKVYKI